MNYTFKENRSSLSNNSNQTKSTNLFNETILLKNFQIDYTFNSNLFLCEKNLALENMDYLDEMSNDNIKFVSSSNDNDLDESKIVFQTIR
jgi:hypothetical protein